MNGAGNAKNLSRGGRLSPAPQWDGSDPSGKTILLYCEQGLGDAIQFVRDVSAVGGAWRESDRHGVPSAASRTLIANVPRRPFGTWVEPELDRRRSTVNYPCSVFRGLWARRQETIPRLRTLSFSRTRLGPSDGGNAFPQKRIKGKWAWCGRAIASIRTIAIDPCPFEVSRRWRKRRESLLSVFKKEKRRRTRQRRRRACNCSISRQKFRISQTPPP